VDLLRGGLAANPGNPRLSETLAFCLNYDHRAGAAEVFEAHKTFGAMLERDADAREAASGAGAGARWVAGAAGAGRRDPSARIRVGYVSPDFRDHAVATFFEPLLGAHDRAVFEVFIYHTVPTVDDVTRRLQRRADHWFGSRVVSDDELLAQVRADRLDILVDLAGLSSQNRLGVMARRGAPVQATFIGYPCTTGLTRIEYQIVDGITDPPGAEAFSTERLARLPHCLLCYAPPPGCPEVTPPPSLVRGADGEERGFTFASFNTVGKTTDFTLGLWARVLEGVPGSRLLLKASGLSDAAMHERFIARAEAAGIARDRLVLLGHTPRLEHMAAYAAADVCLDPFPFNGATTTCDALWMGVPVVTLRGDRHVARASASILTALGRPEWIAGSEDEYVRIAAELAGNPDGLAQERSSLRERMRTSPLRDAAGYAKAVEALYRSWLEAPASASSEPGA
jgi:predicted O-linked N-acetylglucosamine transferase (SPINDLY family)